MGTDFQCILQHFGIKNVATSVRNPQANAVCKCLHQSVGNALHIFLSQELSFNITNIAELVDSTLATALHASRSMIHRTLGMMPGGIIFSCDMVLNIPLCTDFHILQTHRQAIIDDNLCRTNSKHGQHDYQTGDG
jgi:hypothetical protein